MNSNKDNIKEAIICCFNQNNITYRFEEKDDMFDFIMPVDDSKLNEIRFIIIIHADSYMVYSKYPIKADTSDSRIYELICSMNNLALSGGNFEINDNGEIRYKFYVPCSGICPTQQIIEESINTPLRFFIEYNDAINNVIFTDMSAKEAFEECEPDIFKFLKLLEASSTSSKAFTKLGEIMKSIDEN